MNYLNVASGEPVPAGLAEACATLVSVTGINDGRLSQLGREWGDGPGLTQWAPLPALSAQHRPITGSL